MLYVLCIELLMGMLNDYVIVIEEGVIFIWLGIMLVGNEC